MEGLVIGHYRVTHRLGAGGMAEVYMAKHELMDRYAAMKFLHPEMSVREDIVKRFFQEARAAARIEHPGIVHVFDVGYAPGGRAYLAMELLSGESLSQRLKQRKRLSLESTVAVIRQLAGAMGAAHRRGIVHRDLKPDNMFLALDPEMPRGERVKVLDFGLAKLLESSVPARELTAQGAIFGTPAYMAPEQCQSAASVDERADLYSMGCIFYTCLTGTPPFGAGGVEVLMAHLGRAPVPPRQRVPSIPTEIDALILRLLEKEPAARLQSCEELIAALDQVISSSPRLRRHAKGLRDDEITIRDEQTIKGTVALAAEIERGASPDARLPETRRMRPQAHARSLAALDVHARAHMPVELGGPWPRGPDAEAPPRTDGVRDPGQVARGSTPSISNGELERRPERERARRIVWSLAATGFLGGLMATGLVLGAGEEQAATRILSAPKPATHVAWIAGKVAAHERADGGASPAADARPTEPLPTPPSPTPPSPTIDELMAQAEHEVSARAWDSAVTILRQVAAHEDLDEQRRARVIELGRQIRTAQRRQKALEQERARRRQIRSEIEATYQRGEHALVLERCRDAQEIATGDGELVALCGLAACKAKNAQTARRYYRHAPTSKHRSWIAQTCLKQGLDIQK